MKKFIVLAVFFLHIGGLAFAEQKTVVSLYFAEALDPTDSVSSKKFQQEYETAIDLGSELISQKIAQCGFKLNIKKQFYSVSDPLQALERGKAAKSENAWLVVGPRRSNHYMLLVNGAKDTPTVSLMASSNKIKGLGKLHLSMVPTNSIMARGAVFESKEWIKNGKNKKYVSIVSAECTYCKDFANQFDLEAESLGLKNAKSFEVVGKAPDLKNIIKELKKINPSFILIPNYSYLSSFVISKLHVVNKGWFFVGADGWGALKEGFVVNGRDIVTAKGFSVRGNPSVEKGLTTFGLGRRLTDIQKGKITSSSPMTILRVFDSLGKFLCKHKPKTKKEFDRSYVKYGSNYFSAPWGVSVFQLEKQTITYLKPAGRK
jgi:hypothetical protein